MKSQGSKPRIYHPLGEKTLPFMPSTLQLGDFNLESFLKELFK